MDSGASAKTTATVAGTGARYARAARTRAKKRAKKKVKREIRLAGDLDVARGALSQTPSGEINRCMRALGGTRGVFGAFLREQLVEVKAEIALMPEARPRAAGSGRQRPRPARAAAARGARGARGGVGHEAAEIEGTKNAGHRTQKVERRMQNAERGTKKEETKQATGLHHLWALGPARRRPAVRGDQYVNV